MKAAPCLCVPLSVAIASIVMGTSSHAASIVKASYSLNGKNVARMIYTGSDGGPNSDRDQYWSLLGKAPEAAYDVKIKPDNAGGKAATLAGEISVSIEIRNKFNMGTAKTDQLALVRDDANSDRWYIPAGELKRLTALIDKEPVRVEPKPGQDSPVETAAAADPSVFPLDVSRFKYHEGRIPDQPEVCETREKLIKSLGEEMARQNLSKIDFTTHEVLVFRWDNSGTDKFEVIEPKESDEPWIFLMTRGFTKAKIPDIRAYAILRKVSWEFKSVRKGDQLLPE